LSELHAQNRERQRAFKIIGVAYQTGLQSQRCLNKAKCLQENGNSGTANEARLATSWLRKLGE
jgi:hypothetical protein